MFFKIRKYRKAQKYKEKSNIKKGQTNKRTK